MVTLLAASLPAVASGACWQCDPLEKQVSVDQQIWHWVSTESRPLLTNGSQLDKVLGVVSPLVNCHPGELHPAAMLCSCYSKASCLSIRKH